MSDKTYTAKQIAEMASEFVESEFGQMYLNALNLSYNGLHQAAESEELTAERKGLKIERAAGVKLAITWLTGKDALVKAGHYKEKK
jgi:hypothetical protein